MKDFICDFFYYLGEALLLILTIVFIVFTVGVGFMGIVLVFVLCFVSFTWMRLGILCGIILYYCILYALYETIESR